MGLPISFCQEGFLRHNYLLRPTLYISGDKMCQTQGVSSLWINFPWRSLLQDLEGRSSCTLPSAEERLLPLSHLLTPTCPPGRSDARVWPGISSTLSSLQPAPRLLSLTPQSAPPPPGEGGLLPPCYSIQDWVGDFNLGGDVQALFFKSVLSRIKLIR